jgi:GntR family transcriptional regulator
LRLLQEEGFVERFPGRGTFVRRRQPGKLTILNTDFAGSIQEAAPGVSRKLLRRTEDVPPTDVAELLGLQKGEACLMAERVDVLRREPLAYDRAYFPLPFSEPLDEALLSEVDFLEPWLRGAGLRGARFKQWIEAMGADRDAAEKLKLTEGVPVLHALEVLYDEASMPLAVFDSVYRGDRFKIATTNRWKSDG